MFNWFRRKINKTDSEPVSEPTEQVTQPETETSDQESTSEDYLSWAKTAYKNIQQRQTPSTTPISTTEAPSETPEKEVPSETKPSPQPEPESPKTEAKEDTPAWMQKSDRLEALKETALETATVEETTPLTFDEEFVWSAKVLAAQGRAPDDISEDEINWLKRLRQGLGKSRRGLVNQLKSIVGQGPLNEDAVMEIEALLLQADTGIEATDHIISTLQNKLLEEALPPEQALEYLKSILREILDRPLQKVVNPGFAPEKGVLNIWLLTGVNGAGKTTTIGKLAHLAQQSGYDCIIAAADTFRAAAVEQVKVWGERTNTPVIANPGKNTDPAAVVFEEVTNG